MAEVSVAEHMSRQHPLALKSNEEYTAMAMLLGYRYSRIRHSFYKMDDIFASTMWLDPDTLAPSDYETSVHRAKHWHAHYYPNDKDHGYD